MRKMLGMATATVFALMAGGAVAAEATGTISNIDLTRNTFQLKGGGTEVEGWTFTAAPNNTVGEKLSDLEEGDKVTVEYSQDASKQKQPINVMMLKKAE
jgi:DNA topoisomerase IA